MVKHEHAPQTLGPGGRETRPQASDARAQRNGRKPRATATWADPPLALRLLHELDEDLRRAAPPVRTFVTTASQPAPPCMGTRAWATSSAGIARACPRSWLGVERQQAAQPLSTARQS